MSALAEKRLAIVGPAGAALPWVEASLEFPELVVGAVVGSEPVPSAGAPRFARVWDMLESGWVPELAIVCTPPGERAEPAEPLLRASVDLLLDPPLASTPYEADHISSLAERFGRVALAASPYRTLPAVAEAHARIARGEIGRLCHLDVVLCGKQAAGSGWRGDPELGGGGVWMEYGPHALDVVESLAGPVRRIRMLSSESRQRAEVEDEVRVEAEHDAGLISSIRTSWNEHAAGPVARCTGDRGELLIGRAQTLLRDETGVEQVITAGCGERDGFRHALARFLRAVRCPELVPDSGAQTVAWLHAAYRSLRDARWELC